MRKEQREEGLITQINLLYPVTIVKHQDDPSHVEVWAWVSDNEYLPLDIYTQPYFVVDITEAARKAMETGRHVDFQKILTIITTYTRKY